MSPEKIAEFDKITGLGSMPNKGVVPPVSEIQQAAARGLATKAAQTKSSKVMDFAKSMATGPATIVARPFQAVAELAGVSDESVNKFSKDYLGGIVAPTPKTGADVMKDVGRGFQTVALGVEGAPMAAGAAFGFGSSLEQGNKVLSLPTLFETTLGAAAGKVLDFVGKPILNAAGDMIGKVTPEYLQNIASKGAQAVKDFAESHNILPEGVSSLIEKGTKALSEAETSAGKYINEGVRKMTGQLTEAEILATPKELVYKLSERNRKIYTDAKAREINMTHSDMTSRIDAEFKTNINQLTDDFKSGKISSAKEYTQMHQDIVDKHLADVNKANETLQSGIQAHREIAKIGTEQADTALKTKMEASSAEIQQLKQEMTDITYGTTLETRPKVTDALGKKSDIYQEIWNADVAPHAKVPVQHSELSSQLDKIFSDNPAAAADMKAKLGITADGQTTVGKLTTEMKRLRGTISTAAKKGTRVFSANELNIEKSMGAISDVLKNQGIDLSRANQFWREWAPVRDALVSKVKPFGDIGIATKNFRGMLEDVTSAKPGHIPDPDNVQFMKILEDVLGEPLPPNIRATAEKLSATEKQAVADEIATKLEKEGITKQEQTSISDVREKHRLTVEDLNTQRTETIRELEKAKIELSDNKTTQHTENVRRLRDKKAKIEQLQSKAKSEKIRELESTTIENARLSRNRKIKKGIIMAVLGYPLAKKAESVTGIKLGIPFTGL